MMYQLTINEEQAKIINEAMESFFRIRMNQWGDLAEDLASVGFVYNPADPDNGRKFNDYLTRREHAKMLLEQAMMAAQPQRGYKAMEIPEKCLIAQDIWQVIRHQLYLDEIGGKECWHVASRKPLQMSEEPLPVIERMENDAV